jgi:hypothetical protein
MTPRHVSKKAGCSRALPPVMVLIHHPQKTRGTPQLEKKQEKKQVTSQVTSQEVMQVINRYLVATRSTTVIEFYPLSNFTSRRQNLDG